MKDFIITTDSTVDMPKEYLEDNKNPVLSLSYIIEGKTYEDMKGLAIDEFYEKIRQGAMPTTSQVNPDQVKKVFEPILKEGKDILHIAFSSGLSGSYNSARIMGEELSEQYPDAKIIVIDSLCASMGEGFILYKANEMKKNGKSIDEIAEWIRANILKICHVIAVDDLFHLQRGGRVSKATAIVGSVVNIKPILHVDETGKLIPIGKVRGRKKSLTDLVDRMEVQAKGVENDIVMISHSDCYEDAKSVANQITERFGIQNIMIHSIGTVIGSHTGIGTVALFFVGNKR